MLIALAIFVIASGTLIETGMRISNAVLLGFDLGAIVFLAILARLFNQSSPTRMRRQAKAQDTGRWGILWSRGAAGAGGRCAERGADMAFSQHHVCHALRTRFLR